MKTFLEALNESKVTIEDTPFVLTVYNDNSGIAIQFMPAKSKDFYKWSTNEIVAKIEEILNKALPDLSGAFYYESGKSNPAGYVFRLQSSVLQNLLTKKLK